MGGFLKRDAKGNFDGLFFELFYALYKNIFIGFCRLLLFCGEFLDKPD
jgi:hypothetical protein